MISATIMELHVVESAIYSPYQSITKRIHERYEGKIQIMSLEKFEIAYL